MKQQYQNLLRCLTSEWSKATGNQDHFIASEYQGRALLERINSLIIFFNCIPFAPDEIELAIKRMQIESYNNYKKQ